MIEGVTERDGFTGSPRLHPVIVHELGLPDSCLYLPPLTDSCCHSVWDGPQSASPSPQISSHASQESMTGKRLIYSVSVSLTCSSFFLNILNEMVTSWRFGCRCKLGLKTQTAEHFECHFPYIGWFLMFYLVIFLVL